jgi:hypothetical protein
MRKSMLAVAAAVSMIGAGAGSGGALAQSAVPPSASAAALSLDPAVRASADLREASDLRGGFILPTLALLGVIALIYVLTKDGDPASP